MLTALTHPMSAGPAQPQPGHSGFGMSYLIATCSGCAASVRFRPAAWAAYLTAMLAGGLLVEP